MSDMLLIPRLAEDEDLPRDVKAGLDAFARNLQLAEEPERRDKGDGFYTSTDVGLDWVEGWQLGWRRCYGQGVKSAIHDADRECQYPQFTGPWEAWTQGHDDAPTL